VWETTDRFCLEIVKEEIHLHAGYSRVEGCNDTAEARARNAVAVSGRSGTSATRSAGSIPRVTDPLRQRTEERFAAWRNERAALGVTSAVLCDGASFARRPDEPGSTINLAWIQHRHSPATRLFHPRRSGPAIGYRPSRRNPRRGIAPFALHPAVLIDGREPTLRPRIARTAPSARCGFNLRAGELPTHDSQLTTFINTGIRHPLRMAEDEARHLMRSRTRRKRSAPYSHRDGRASSFFPLRAVVMVQRSPSIYFI